MAPVNNFDLNNKKILNLDVMDDYKTDDPYEYRVKDLKSAVNKEYENFFEKRCQGQLFRFTRKCDKNSEPYYDGLYDDRDLVSKEYVDLQKAKQNTTIRDKANKDYVFTGMEANQ